MIEYLTAARAAIILWINLALIPAEIHFNAMKAHLERRRRVEPRRLLSKPIRSASCTERHCDPNETAADA